MSFLEVKDLYLYYRTRKGMLHAVDDVSFSVGKGEALALIGESGCGKSSLARCLIRLLPRNVEVFNGHIYLNGTDLMRLSDEDFRKMIRWRKISMVPQAALNSLNPVIKVGEQVAEPLLIHGTASREEALEKVRKMFSLVGIPEAFMERYPFELSGGMRQRAMIAMALIMDPEVVILDEPTSALDVLTQANIMNMLKKIKREYGVTFILITHDVSVSSELADKVAVMYGGQIVELSEADDFYKAPLHPYSQKLMASIPSLREEKNLEYIPGSPVSLINPPRGCRFADRCPYRMEKCSSDPPLITINKSYVKCWLYAK
jgi:oligopeptide/dipeptide ABC transporter ATP-binding protein